MNNYKIYNELISNALLFYGYYDHDKYDKNMKDMYSKLFRESPKVKKTKAYLSARNTRIKYMANAKNNAEIIYRRLDLEKYKNTNLGDIEKMIIDFIEKPVISFMNEDILFFYMFLWYADTITNNLDKKFYDMRKIIRDFSQILKLRLYNDAEFIVHNKCSLKKSNNVNINLLNYIVDRDDLYINLTKNKLININDMPYDVLKKFYKPDSENNICEVISTNYGKIDLFTKYKVGRLEHYKYKKEDIVTSCHMKFIHGEYLILKCSNMPLFNDYEKMMANKFDFDIRKTVFYRSIKNILTMLDCLYAEVMFYID